MKPRCSCCSVKVQPTSVVILKQVSSLLLSSSLRVFSHNAFRYPAILICLFLNTLLEMVWTSFAENGKAFFAHQRAHLLWGKYESVRTSPHASPESTPSRPENPEAPPNRSEIAPRTPPTQKQRSKVDFKPLPTRLRIHMPSPSPKPVPSRAQDIPRWAESGRPEVPS